MTTPETNRQQAWWLGLAVVAVFAVPGPLVGTFDGLPWSHPVEALLAGLVALTLLVRAARQRLVTELAALTKRVRPLPWVLAALAVVKVLAFAAAPSGGLVEACYRGGVEPATPQCTVSFENPWNRSGATRFDSAIDFGPTPPGSTTISDSNWNLATVNDLLFNEYRLPGNVDMERFPFHARWTGTVDVDAAGQVNLRYVGEGNVTIGDQKASLPPSYATDATVTLPVPPGRHDLQLEFAFTSTVLVGDTPQGPYATLRVTGATPTGASVAVTVLTWVVDLVMIAALLALLAVLVLALGPWLLGIFAASATWAVTQVLVTVGALPELVRNLVPVTALVGAVGLVLVAVRWPTRLLPWGATFAVLLGVTRTIDFLGSWSQVLFRGRGDDWLTYHSYARTILAEYSLRGGEDVFYFQPGYRYLVFFGRLFVGDGDAALGALQVIALSVLAVLLAVAVNKRASDSVTRLLTGTFAATVMVFAASDYLVERAAQGLSEIPTWIGLVAMGVLVLDHRPLRRTMLIAVIVGLVITVRPNQGIAMVLMLVLAGVMLVVTRPPGWWRIAVASFAVMLAIALTPLAHNVMYGGEFEPSSTNSRFAQDLAPRDIAQFWRDGEVRTVLVEKTQGLLNLGSPKPEVQFSTLSPILGFQLLWVTSLVMLTLRRLWAPRRVTMWLIAVWPFAYAAPHYVYDVWNYYPRHIVAFNLGLATSGLVLLAFLARDVSPSDSRSITEPSPQPHPT